MVTFLKSLGLDLYGYPITTNKRENLSFLLSEARKMEEVQFDYLQVVVSNLLNFCLFCSELGWESALPGDLSPKMCFFL